MNKIITVGCDPEIFVLDANNKLVSAYGMVEGTKSEPQKVRGGAVQVDGMALEINIRPAATSEEFIVNVETVLDRLTGLLPEGHSLSRDIIVAEFGYDYINSQPAQAVELGCDPDFNGWTTVANPRPDVKTPFRTGAGHIHIGFVDGIENDEQANKHYDLCCEMAKAFDFYIGLPSIIYDTEQRRRELYGKAGAFRPKVYGMEYRTPSNAWLRDEKLMKWIFEATVEGYRRFATGERLAEHEGDIQETINTGDVEAAKAIIARNAILMPEGF